MTSNGTNATIFIVEDEALIATDLESRLKALGYTVCGSAISAEEAWPLIEQHRPDLVMLDIALSGAMDGIEAAELIRAKWGIPVVFITAFPDADRLERAKLTYPFGYLIKPIHDRDLIITIKMALYAGKVDAERGEAEKRIKDSEERYRSLFDNMLNGFAYCRMLYREGQPEDFIYISVNKAFSELTGLRDVVGKRVTEVIPGIKETTPELFDVYGRVADTGQPEQLEIDFIPLNIWLHISVYSPQKGYFVAVFENITERIKIEEALRESESFIRTVMDHLPIGVAVNSVDPSVEFTYTNDNFSKFYRTTREDLADEDSFWGSVYEDPEFRAKIREKVLADCASGDSERMYWKDIPITRRGERQPISPQKTSGSQEKTG